MESNLSRKKIAVAGIGFISVIYITLAGYLIASGMSALLFMAPIIAFIIVLIALRMPIILLTIVAFFIPLESYVTFQGASVNRYLIILLLAVWLFDHLVRKKPFEIARASWFMIFWVGFALLSYFWGPAIGGFFNYFFGFLLALILMVITPDMISNQKHLTWVLLAFMTGILIFLVVWFIFGANDIHGFYIPIIGESKVSEVGTALGWGTACLLALALFSPSKKIFAISIPLLAIAVYLFLVTALRRNFLTIPFVVLGLLVFQKKPSWRAIWILAILFLMAWLGWNIIFPALPSVIKNRFLMRTIVESGGTGRIELYALAYNLFQGSPLFGVGLGGYQVFAGSMIGRATFAHNAYLEVLSQTGLIGFILWGGAVWLVSIGLIRAYNSCENNADRIILAIPLALLLFMIVNGTVDGYENYRPFWFALGLGLAATNIVYPHTNLPKRVTDQNLPVQ